VDRLALSVVVTELSHTNPKSSRHSQIGSKTSGEVGGSEEGANESRVALGLGGQANSSRASVAGAPCASRSKSTRSTLIRLFVQRA